MQLSRRPALVRGAQIAAALSFVLSFSLIGLVGAALRASDVGKDWGIERESYVDPVSKVRVWELTQGTNAADNLYYHFSNFSPDNRHLIFVSNRTGSWQIFRADVETGRIVQLTDDLVVNARSACPDHTNARRLYYLHGPEVIALDIVDFIARKVGEIPKPHVGGFQQPTLSGDGEWMTLTKQRDENNWEIGLMNTKSGAYRTVITQGFRIGHVQHVKTVHAHASFDRLGRYVLFHTGRTHETVALIDLKELPAGEWTK